MSAKMDGDATIEGEREGIVAAGGDAGHGRMLAALCIAAFLAALNFFAPSPFYPEISRDLNTTVPLLGQIATVLGLLSAGLGLVVGPLADRFGYRWPLVIGILAIAVNLAGIGLAPSYPVVLALSVCGGLGDALVFGLPLAIAGTRFSGDGQRRALGWILGSLSFAPIVGVPLLTAIGGSVGWRTALVLAGMTAAGAAVFVASALPPDEQHQVRPLRLGALAAAYAPLRSHAPTLSLLGATTLRSITWLGLITYLGAFLGEQIGLSIEQIGLVYTASGVGYAGGSLIAGRTAIRNPRLAVAVTCAIVAAGVALLPLLNGIVPAMLLLLVMSFAAATAGLNIAALLAAESPAGAGTTMVLNGSLFSLGATGGAITGGLLIARGGYDALAYGLPLFSLLAAALVWRPARHLTASDIDA